MKETNFDENDSLFASNEQINFLSKEDSFLMKPKEESPPKYYYPKNPNFYAKDTKKKSSRKSNKFFNTLWIIVKCFFQALWMFLRILFIIGVLIFSFLDGLIFRDIRMKEIRIRAAKKAAETRKRKSHYF